MLRGKTTRLTLTSEDIAWHTERQVARRQLAKLAKASARRVERDDEITVKGLSPTRSIHTKMSPWKGHVAQAGQACGESEHEYKFEPERGLNALKKQTTRSDWNEERALENLLLSEQDSSPILSPPQISPMHSFSLTHSHTQSPPSRSHRNHISPPSSHITSPTHEANTAIDLAPPPFQSGNLPHLQARSPVKKASPRNLSVYNDELPATAQPQTPVGLSRNGLPLLVRSPFATSVSRSERGDAGRQIGGAQGQSQTGEGATAARMRIVRLRRGREFVRFELR